MKPLRPAWITILAACILLLVTAWFWWQFGPVVALGPFALTLAFIYDLTHHAKSWQVKILSRAIVCLALAAVIITGVYFVIHGKTAF
jgi:hypothetical protein